MTFNLGKDSLKIDKIKYDYQNEQENNDFDYMMEDLLN